MEPGRLDAKAGLDRFATIDEIQAALTFSADDFNPRETGNLMEVPSDSGGYVRISSETEDAPMSILLEKLDAAPN